MPGTLTFLAHSLLLLTALLTLSSLLIPFRSYQNGASCHDGIASFTCTCVAGWSGVMCGTAIDECASGPCLVRLRPLPHLLLSSPPLLLTSHSSPSLFSMVPVPTRSPPTRAPVRWATKECSVPTISTNAQAHHAWFAASASPCSFAHSFFSLTPLLHSSLPLLAAWYLSRQCCFLHLCMRRTAQRYTVR